MGGTHAASSANGKDYTSAGFGVWGWEVTPGLWWSLFATLIAKRVRKGSRGRVFSRNAVGIFDSHYLHSIPFSLCLWSHFRFGTDTGQTRGGSWRFCSGYTRCGRPGVAWRGSWSFLAWVIGSWTEFNCILRKSEWNGMGVVPKSKMPFSSLLVNPGVSLVFWLAKY